MNELKRLVVTHIETGDVVVDVTDEFGPDRAQVSNALTDDALSAWRKSGDALYYDHPIGTIKEAGGYRFEFRKPEPKIQVRPQPESSNTVLVSSADGRSHCLYAKDADGWIVNNETMPDCESVDVRLRNGVRRFNEDPEDWIWDDVAEESEQITHWRPAKAEQVKPQPDVEGWIVNTGTMPDFNGVIEVELLSGARSYGMPRDFSWEKVLSPDSVTFTRSSIFKWRPANEVKNLVPSVDSTGTNFLGKRFDVNYAEKAETPKPKGVREVTRTVWLDSDDCEHETEQAAIESDLDGNHGLSLHVYAKPDGSSDADAIELFKRILELRK